MMFKQMGVGLAFAILLDATLIRGVLLPATMKLLGDRNWWLPRKLGWLPDGHARGRGGARRGVAHATAHPGAASGARRSPGGRRSASDPVQGLSLMNRGRRSSRLRPCPFPPPSPARRRECAAAFAAWSGFDSPLRHRPAPSTCLAGGHAIWWRVEAATHAAALALLPRYVAERTLAIAGPRREIP